MSLSVLNAAALAGLVLVALPIAIHLLARTQTRVVPFPSLRFVRETALAAFRRRAVQDAGLLACRAGILAAAALALSGPVLHSDARAAAYASRVSRALVALEPGVTTPEGLEADAFRFTRTERALPGDALADAVRWLDRQPSSAREIVVAGAFRRGSITEADLLLVPAGIGLRFAEVPAADAPARVTVPMLVRRSGALVRIDQVVTFDAGGTRVTEGAMVPVAADHVRVMAAPADQALADAALAAALDVGVPFLEGPVEVIWQGSGNRDQGVTVRMAVPSPPDSAARAVWRALVEAGPPPPVEPERIARADLDAWSRPSGPPLPTAPLADEGDQRWGWALALVLLALEHVLRRHRATDAAVTAAAPEARVA